MPNLIARRASACDVGFVRVHLSSTDSTNAAASLLAHLGGPHGAAVRADRQTAGKGRLGRTWSSEDNGNLYLSVVLRPNVPLERVPLVCLAAAVATAEVAGPAYRIKWPNDVQAPDGRKVAGILAELELERGAVRHVIVGVGVNLTDSPALPTATSLREADGLPRDRGAFADLLTKGLVAISDTLERAPDDLLVRWRARSSTLGKQVRIGAVEGLAVDVDPTGALVVDTATGRQRVLAGDVEMVRTTGT